ncbi:MAG: hypothetical protein H6Q82_2601, partial [Deltaproteobacteria bacterium]|nr:hypothetical protein [Deltaproteobacteria bacterium]
MGRASSRRRSVTRSICSRSDRFGGEHFHVHPVPLAKSTRYRVETADVPGDEDEPVPFGGEAPREGVPDPRGRPGHER